MTLEELLHVIPHHNYTVYVQNSLTEVMGQNLKLDGVDDLKAHFDYPVLMITEDWDIIIKGE